jgi:ferredoxin
MAILFFSATGNGLYVAKTLGTEIKSIPQLERTGTYEIEDEVIGIISPVYIFTLPLLVQRYLKKAKLKADYIFGVLTYGSRGGAATTQLLKALEANGNTLHYAADLLMVDNFLPGFKMEEEIAKLPKKAIDTHLAKIKHDTESRKHSIPHKSALWRTTSAIISSLMSSKRGINWINNRDRQFSVTDKCIGCSTCARVCPVSNILVEDGPTFLHHCEWCLACIQNCPTGAIQMKTQKSEARFRNKNVTLKELIEANEQESLITD